MNAEIEMLLNKLPTDKLREILAELKNQNEGTQETLIVAQESLNQLS